MITSVVTDSRAAGPGSLFVCIKGARVDGHDYAAAALAQGAAAVLVQHPVDGVPEDRCIRVADPLDAMIAIGGNYREKFSPVLVGVTGSVGKTTTKEFCAAVLGAFGKTLKTEGNQNNEIGVPNTLFRITEETEYAVVEMGMSALGEIERLSRAARPDAGLITCIGVSHLESLGSRENILKAKLEICTGLPDGAPLALNVDDEYLQLARREGMLPARLRPVWYGMNDPEADVRAVEVKPLENGMAFTLEDKEHGRFAVTIPALGMHSVYDALAAYAAATRMGLDAARCAAALADYQTTGMRQKVVENGGRVFIEDCYNASPDSMRASLNMFREYPCKGRRFALLGDMLELGSIEEEAHRQVGRWAAESGLAHLVTLGSASRFAADEAEKSGLAVTRCQTHEEAAQVLAGLMAPGDALLAKGSRGMRLEQVLQLLYTGETQTNN